MTRRIQLGLEIVRAEALEREALPALEAARAGDGRLLAETVRTALPRLRARPASGEAHALAVARLEALLATAPEPPATEAAFEEVTWALLRAARVAEPVSLGEDWDLLRVLIDPARRRGRGLGSLGATLAGAALAGSGPLASSSGFALARESSYATGWNSPARASRIARSLRRFDRLRLERTAAAVSDDVARSIYPRRMSPLAKRLPRALAALEKLTAAYELAAREEAGVFLELELD